MSKQIVTQITRNDSGIYYIKNLNNKKLYIGQSIQLGERTKQHMYALENGTHQIKEIQKDYNSGDRFRIGIVQKVSRKCLNGLEIYYILKWNTHIVGYNSKLGCTDNFDEALRIMITPKQIDDLNKSKLEEEAMILSQDTYKNSALSTINFLMKKNNWTIDDIFFFFKNSNNYLLNKL